METLDRAKRGDGVAREYPIGLASILHAPRDISRFVRRLAKRRQSKPKTSDAEKDDYRLRYYALKAAFDRSVAEADILRRLYAKEMARNKITVLVDE